MKEFLPATAVIFFIGRILGGPDGVSKRGENGERNGKTEREMGWSEEREGGKKKCINWRCHKQVTGILGIKGRVTGKGAGGEGVDRRGERLCRGEGEREVKDGLPQSFSSKIIPVETVSEQYRSDKPSHPWMISLENMFHTHMIVLRIFRFKARDTYSTKLTL